MACSATPVIAPAFRARWRRPARRRARRQAPRERTRAEQERRLDRGRRRAQREQRGAPEKAAVNAVVAEAEAWVAERDQVLGAGAREALLAMCGAVRKCFDDIDGSESGDAEKRATAIRLFGLIDGKRRDTDGAVKIA